MIDNQREQEQREREARIGSARAHAKNQAELARAFSADVWVLVAKEIEQEAEAERIINEGNT